MKHLVLMSALLFCATLFTQFASAEAKKKVSSKKTTTTTTKTTRETTEPAEAAAAAPKHPKVDSNGEPIPYSSEELDENDASKSTVKGEDGKED